MSSSNKIYNVVRDELFDCGEAVFKSIRKYYILIFHHIFLMILGIHDMVIRTINCCDPNITSSLKQNIVLCGGKFYHLIYKKYMFIHLGTTLMTGFVEQMKEELLRSQTDAEIKAPHNRNSLAFIGANKLISSLEINNLWVSADGYKAAGSSIIYRKCF